MSRIPVVAFFLLFLVSLLLSLCRRLMLVFLHPRLSILTVFFCFQAMQESYKNSREGERKSVTNSSCVGGKNLKGPSSKMRMNEYKESFYALCFVRCFSISIILLLPFALSVHSYFVTLTFCLSVCLPFCTFHVVFP